MDIFYKNCAPKKFTITSNGYYMSDMLQFAQNLKKFPNSLVELNISMDGIQEQHDEIRQRRGVFSNQHWKRTNSCNPSKRLWEIFTWGSSRPR